MSERIGRDLALLLDLANSCRLNCLDIQDAARDLESRPVWTGYIPTVLIDVEKLLNDAIDAIHETQQRLDSMPVHISLSQAAE